VTVLVVAEAFVLALLLLLVAGLLRSHAEILRRLHDLGAGREGEGGDATPRSPARRQRSTASSDHQFNVLPGIPAPADGDAAHDHLDLSGRGVADDALSIRVTGVDHATLVAFLSSTCLTCQRFWDAFADPGLDLPPATRLVVVTKGIDEESPSKVGRLAPQGVPLVMSSEAWADYDVPGSPYFVLVDGPTGRVRGEGTGLDWPQVRNLLGQAGDDADHLDGLAASRVRKPTSDATREQRVDQELLDAGIAPGDPSLHRPAAPGTNDDDIDITDHTHGANQGEIPHMHT
jgi:hypothetical protein